jgi:hypothetical protein
LQRNIKDYTPVVKTHKIVKFDSGIDDEMVGFELDDDDNKNE